MDLNQLFPLLWAVSQNTTFPISPNQILLAFWSMCSSEYLITQHISRYFGFVFCCLSLSSFWPYCKVPKSKSNILEDFRFKLSSLAYSPQLSRNFKPGSLLFLWRLPLACTVYRIQGWLVGAEFQESIEKKNRPNFRTPSLSLPDKLGNLRLWCFEHFLLRSCAHYDCGGGSREVNETKYKWKQTETNWTNSAVAAKAKYENKCKIKKIQIQIHHTKLARAKN